MVLVLCWCFGGGLQAQTKPFSSDQALFLQEVTERRQEGGQALHRGGLHPGLDRHLV
jgi:hypothetical protein